MSIDKDTIHKIATLARLKIDADEAASYGEEITEILRLVEQMDAADTDDVAPMTHPFDATMRLREDKVTASDNRTRLQEIAPQSENGLYLVPKVID